MQANNLNQNVKKWYVAYTYPQAERKVQRRVRELGLETFLPLTKIRRQWSDRVKLIEVPLFANYVFVKTTENNIPWLTDVNGIARFVAFGEKYAIARPNEIDILKNVVQKSENIKVENETFVEGQMVKIKEGPFAGMEGILVRQQGKQKFIIALEGLAKQISIEVPVKYLETRVSSIVA